MAFGFGFTDKNRAVDLFHYGQITKNAKPTTENFYILHEGLIGVVDKTRSLFGILLGNSKHCLNYRRMPLHPPDHRFPV